MVAMVATVATPPTPARTVGVLGNVRFEEQVFFQLRSGSHN